MGFRREVRGGTWKVRRLVGREVAFVVNSWVKRMDWLLVVRRRERWPSWEFRGDIKRGLGLVVELVFTVEGVDSWQCNSPYTQSLAQRG